MAISIKKLTAFVVLIIGLTAFALPAEKSLLQRNAFLVTQPNVGVDMGLTSSQIAQRAEILREFNEKSNSIRSSMTDTTSPSEMEQKQKSLDSLQSDAEKRLLAVLTPAQNRRLKQISLQREGFDALRDAPVATELGLSAAQKAKAVKSLDTAAKAQDDYQGALGDALAKLPDPGTSESEIRAYEAKQQAVIKAMKPAERKAIAVKVQCDKQILSSLTPVQRKKWQAMLGKPLKPGS